MMAKAYPTVLLSCLLIVQAAAQDLVLEPSLPDSLQGAARVKALNLRFGEHLPTDPVAAVGYARQALMLATEIGDIRGTAAAYNNLGVAYRNQGALDKALQYYITSQSLYDSLGNREGIASTRNNIANIYALKKDYGQAMRYFEESRALFEELNDNTRLIGSMNNLGNMYSEINMHEKALEHYEEAVKLGQETGGATSDPVMNIGNLYFNIGNYQIAVDYYQKALEIARNNNNHLGMITILTNLGITFAKAQQPATAQRHLDEALELSETLQAHTMQPAIYKALAENYAAQKRWHDAYQTQRNYDILREQVYSEESSRKIAQMEMILSFQEKERELEILRREDEIKSAKLRNTRLMIGLIVMSVLVVGAAALAYTTRKRIAGRQGAPKSVDSGAIR